MKRIAFILGFVFVAGLGMSTMATKVITDNGLKTTIVDNDKKPCPEGCTCADCKAKATNGKVACDSTKAATCTKKSADCTKKCDGNGGEAKKGCCAKSDNNKTATPAAEPAKK